MHRVCTASLVLGRLGLLGLLGTGVACGPTKAEIQRERLTVEASSQTEEIQLRIADYAREFDACPGGSSGSTPITPPLAVPCAQGRYKLCVPGGSGPSAYPWSAWAEPAGWRDMTYVPVGPHAYHYRYAWSSTDDSCQFTVQAFGDLDDDGMFSTYTRVGRVKDGDLELREPEVTAPEE